jgi:hypothetical protein
LGYRALTAGGCNRLHRNLKAGAFYTLQRGAVRNPLLNLSLNYGLYFPLNFGSTLIYEHAPYVTVLRHVGPPVKLELSGTCRSLTWSTSDDAAADGFDYQIADRRFVLGAGILFTPSL